MLQPFQVNGQAPHAPGPIIPAMTSLTESGQARPFIPGVIIEMSSGQAHLVPVASSATLAPLAMLHAAMLAFPAGQLLAGPRHLSPVCRVAMLLIHQHAPDMVK